MFARLRVQKNAELSILWADEMAVLEELAYSLTNGPQRSFPP
jgi:hypothetical protein